MVTPNDVVADRVRDAMKRANLSQRVVATQTGIAQVTLTRRLMGRASFTAEQLIAIAILADTDPALFLAGLHRLNADAS
jgi:transcriptional regulator with XRE-family HTH domain